MVTHTQMRVGLEIDYRVSPLFGTPLSWRSLITEYGPPCAVSVTA